MANRYTDMDKWDDDWFLRLPPVMKCVWQYLCDNVKGCGEIKISFKKLSDCIGAEIDPSEFAQHFAGRVIMLNSDTAWVPGTLSRIYKSLSPRVGAQVNAAKKILRITEGVELGERGLKVRSRFEEFLNSISDFYLVPSQPLVDDCSGPSQGLARDWLGPDLKEKGEKNKDKREKGGVGGKTSEPENSPPQASVPQGQLPPAPPGYGAFAERFDPEKQKLCEGAAKVVRDVLGANLSPGWKNLIPAMLRSVNWDPDEFVRIMAKIEASFESRDDPPPLSYREVSVKREFGLIREVPS